MQMKAAWVSSKTQPTPLPAVHHHALPSSACCTPSTVHSLLLSGCCDSPLSLVMVILFLLPVVLSSADTFRMPAGRAMGGLGSRRTDKVRQEVIITCVTKLKVKQGTAVWTQCEQGGHKGQGRVLSQR